MPLALLTLWSYVKKYWSYIVLAIGGIVAFFLLQQKQVSFIDQLKKIQDSHDTELKEIEATREAEKAQHAENLKQLQTTLASVQKQYDDQKIHLEEQKKAEIEQIVTKYKDDPVALAQKLSESTGFKVILPE